jgi:hypothetical protein
MDVCRTDAPGLTPVVTATKEATGPHRSACWLPHTALGLGPDAERIRRRAAGLEVPGDE